MATFINETRAKQRLPWQEDKLQDKEQGHGANKRNTVIQNTIGKERKKSLKVD